MSSYSSANRSLGGALLAFVGGMVVWAVFGDKIKQRVNDNARLSEMKNKVMEKARGISNITQDQFNALVDEVTSGYSKAKGISQNELQDMISDLKMHWYRIKDRWNKDDKDQGTPKRLADSNSGTQGTPPSADINFTDGFNLNS